MLKNINNYNVYLACGVTDLRKSIDGLSILVQEVFELDLFSKCLFVFCNRKKDKIKILQWDNNGFWLYYKRLEKGTFKWPSSAQSETLNVDERQLRWLLDGLTLVQSEAYRPVDERIIV